MNRRVGFRVAVSVCGALVLAGCGVKSWVTAAKAPVTVDSLTPVAVVARIQPG